MTLSLDTSARRGVASVGRAVHVGRRVFRADRYSFDVGRVNP